MKILVFFPVKKMNVQSLNFSVTYTDCRLLYYKDPEKCPCDRISQYFPGDEL